MTFLNKTPKIITLQKIIEGLVKQVEGYAMMGDSLTEFSLKLLDLVTEAAPEYIEIIEHATNIYDDVVQQRYNNAKSIRRVSEDLRDIYERNIAIQRFASEYEAAEKALQQSKAALQKNKGRSNEDLCKSRAKQCLDDTKRSLAVLIEHRERFEKFIGNRLSHAISLYALTVDNTATRGAQLMEEAAAVFANEAIINNPENQNDASIE